MNPNPKTVYDLAPKVTLTLVRHGQPEQGEDDLARRLTNKGIAQANEMGARLRDHRFNFACSSHAVRAKQTRNAILAHQPASMCGELTTETLYMPHREDGDLIGNVLAEVGYKPLSAYEEHPDFLRALDRFAAKFMECLLEELRALYRGHYPEAFNVLIVGHSVFLESVAAYRSSEHVKDDGVVMARNYNLATCEGFRFTAQDGEVVSAEYLNND